MLGKKVNTLLGGKKPAGRCKTRFCDVSQMQCICNISPCCKSHWLLPGVKVKLLTVCIQYVFGMYMIDARVTLVPYSNKVLNVVKAKYDLADKSAAINKFIEIYGRMEVEKEPDDELWKALSKLKSPKNALSAKERKKVEKELEGKGASYVFRKFGLDFKP